MILRLSLLTFLLIFSITAFAHENDLPDWEGGRPDGCTTITVGRAASDGGWVSTSHTCDSHRTRSWFDVQPAKTHKKGDMVQLVSRTTNDSLAMPAYKHIPTRALNRWF